MRKVEYPRVKPDHAPYRFDDGTIRIGGELYGTAAEIKDARGYVWLALQLMDGTRAAGAVAEELRRTFPELSPAASEGLVGQLLDSGYIEDVRQPVPEELTRDDQERYSRNHDFFRRVDMRPGRSGWQAQAALKCGRVTVLGVGGAGSHAAWALAAAGVGRLHCVDHDVVEVSNLTRQTPYTEDDIGRPKVEALAQRLHAVNSGVSVTVERRKVDTEDALAEVIAGSDVLALCADESRGEYINTLADRVCAAAGIPWVGGGYSGPKITIGVYGPGGPCDGCLAAGEEARRRQGPDPVIGGPGVISASAGICGNWIAYEVMSLITGVAKQPPGYLRGLNLMAPDQLVYVRHPSRDSCEACGTARRPVATVD
ncbi:ThiF family adenylyltransferase [Streptomyces sp. NPDC093544]|uniref:HesA/MoeB/ThiF family protein n=1 Tax=Streptomyces sp. NPDC093544 TaxID=3155200 RepID=UPI0034200365